MSASRIYSDNVVGAVLAGGESRRMGLDKALIDLGGETLLARAVTLLRSVLEHVVIIAPVRDAYIDLDVEIVPDLRAGLGPLGGLHTALIHARGAPVFLLACDLPFVCEGLVRWILEVACAPPGPARQVTVAEDQGRVQPLCGLYLGTCLGEVEMALDQGRLSAVELLTCLETEKIHPDPAAAWYHSNLFANLNSVADYRRCRRLGSLGS